MMIGKALLSGFPFHLSFHHSRLRRGVVVVGFEVTMGELLAYRLAPCDLGDPGWGIPVSAWCFCCFTRLRVLPLFCCYHVETMQYYHLLHELAHELAPVTPWFCGFVLCWCFLFALFWWVWFDWCLFLGLVFHF